MKDKSRTPNLETASKLLRLLDQAPYLSQREIANTLKVSLGAVKVERFKESKNKTKYLHLLTPKGLREKTLMTAQFLKLKRKEYERLNDEIEYLEAALSGNDQSWSKKYQNDN